MAYFLENASFDVSANQQCIEFLLLYERLMHTVLLCRNALFCLVSREEGGLFTYKKRRVNCRSLNVADDSRSLL